MEVPRAHIRADTVDFIMSFVSVNFKFEINYNLFTDKMEFLHQVVLISYLKGTWRLELSIHYVLSCSVILKLIVQCLNE